MGEQELARLRQREAATAALDQPLAELHLERPDLLRDGGLGQRELACRKGERAQARDLAERELTAVPGPPSF